MISADMDNVSLKGNGIRLRCELFKIFKALLDEKVMSEKDILDMLELAKKSDEEMVEDAKKSLNKFFSFIFGEDK